MTALATMIFCSGVDAFEAVLLRESFDAGGAAAGTPCLLNPNTNGTCGNYKWYNLCAGYIWVYAFEEGEGVGVLFGGQEQPCVSSGNTVKRVITYYRNVIPEYAGRVDVYLDRDNQGDGCPDGILAATAQTDVGYRWNCWEVAVTLPSSLSHVIVRQVRRGSSLNSRLATDGPFTATCDPEGSPRSFYYGVNGADCQTWIGPTGRYDNFLTWLIIDSAIPNATEPTSWGKIKNLFR